MSEYPAQDVSLWDCHQVQQWLSLKRMPQHIQQKFCDEAIDGEALLYLREQDIEQLLCSSSTVTPIGVRRKLETYIDRLQHTHTANTAFAPTTFKHPVSGSSSLSTTTSSSMSAAHVAFSSLPLFNLHAHHQSSNLLPFESVSPSQHEIIYDDYVQCNQSQSSSTFDQHSHFSFEQQPQINTMRTALENQYDEQQEHKSQSVRPRLPPKPKPPTLPQMDSDVLSISVTCTKAPGTNPSISGDGNDDTPGSDHPSVSHRTSRVLRLQTQHVC